jgi:hypothetical protein
MRKPRVSRRSKNSGSAKANRYALASSGVPSLACCCSSAQALARRETLRSCVFSMMLLCMKIECCILKIGLIDLIMASKVKFSKKLKSES